MNEAVKFIAYLIYLILLIIITCYMVTNYSAWCWLLLLLGSIDFKNKKEN